MSKDQPKPLAELLKYLRDNPIGPGSVVAMDVLHDDDCPALNSNSPMLDCRCEPDYRARTLRKQSGEG
jgi:hypothetical protein